ncbi:hypothetical protein VV02_01845 [Luteipulveratus mongoliensis]|uniref:Uncharacterized protein n=1 Tax=Luteipulveratus mongoliensis TaxID=571913 RepID=A0A0K1JE86_9MICO|nr:hypothetical protein VV02_01845 [Luteipulveratus mongoliensis]
MHASLVALSEMFDALWVNLSRTLCLGGEEWSHIETPLGAESACVELWHGREVTDAPATRDVKRDA